MFGCVVREGRVRLVVVGNPNSGKTSLFNSLTGSNRDTGNWAGVTVDAACGSYIDQDTGVQVDVVDLPGCYSLVVPMVRGSDGGEEWRACKYLAEECDASTVLVNLVDIEHLARDLYLTLQLLERGYSVVVALNRIGGARGVDVSELQNLLGCKVVEVVANRGRSLAALKRAIVGEVAGGRGVDLADQSIRCLAPMLQRLAPRIGLGASLQVLEGDRFLAAKLRGVIDVDAVVNAAQAVLSEPLDMYIARYRRGVVARIVALVQPAVRAKRDVSGVLDRLVLHRYLGPMIFALVMYGLFTVAINLGGVLQGYVDEFSEYYLVHTSYAVMLNLGLPQWVGNIISHGIGRGLNITVSFVPVLSLLFLCLGVLENSGYMVRAAILVDRLMRLFGLSGKALVPLIVGFGCNVPAIMSTRTLPNRRERIVTSMMAPFMSCSARLAIYAVFVAAFFPSGGQNIIFSLYMIGILVALFTAFALRVKAMPGEATLGILEMPNYKIPAVRVLLRSVFYRVREFVVKGGALIIILSVLINGFGTHALAIVGKKITPIFAPMGIKEENWPATVGLMAGLLAKEAVIGTLNAVYSEDMGLHAVQDDLGMSSSIQTEMVQRFGSVQAAYSYLLFSLLYFPCVSVIAAISREIGKGWAAFAVTWSTGLAYLIAVFFYQCTVWNAWASAATAWIVSISVLVSCAFCIVRVVGGKAVKRVSVGSGVSEFKHVPTPVILG